jgi:hypothetical protein
MNIKYILAGIAVPLFTYAAEQPQENWQKEISVLAEVQHPRLGKKTIAHQIITREILHIVADFLQKAEPKQIFLSLNTLEDILFTFTNLNNGQIIWEGFVEKTINSNKKCITVDRTNLEVAFLERTKLNGQKKVYTFSPTELDNLKEIRVDHSCFPFATISSPVYRNKRQIDCNM